ncbi:MAG: S9 family peptidase [Opitutales bacterium]
MSGPVSPEPRPPGPEPRPVSVGLHGDRRIDPFAWLRDDSRRNPSVRAHLEAENAYAAAALSRAASMEKPLYRELLNRIQETDTSAPVRDGNWVYQARTEAGKAYPAYWRWRASASPETATCFFDGNREAAGRPYFSLGLFELSPDGRWLAWALDETGSEDYVLRIRDLDTGEDLPGTIPGVAESACWLPDGSGLFYTERDEAWRPWRVRHHTFLPGNPLKAEGDPVLFEEIDGRYWVSVDLTQDRCWVLIHLASSETGEVHGLPVDAPDTALRCLWSRRTGVEVSLDHQVDRWLAVTNRDHPEFGLLAAPDSSDDPGWQAVWEPAAGETLEDCLPLAAYTVCQVRVDGQVHLDVQPRGGDAWRRYRDRPEPHALALGENPAFEVDRVRLTSSDPVTPPVDADLELNGFGRTVIKAHPVPPGHDPAAYRVERLTVRSADGTPVPVTLVSPARSSGSAPLYLYGYGAYGATLDPDFNPHWLTFLERGWRCAIAHVRGGAFLGHAWYQAGKYAGKRRSIEDFVAVARGLVAAGLTTTGRIVLHGASAGGFLLGAALNAAPDCCAAAVLDVPFVDVLNTMLDPTLPLTEGEYEEWGDPREPEAYAWIRDLAPYENLPEGVRFPRVLATAGLHDSRVGYWEAAKWVARARTRVVNPADLFLRLETAAGHFGESGRYARLRQRARTYAFLLDALEAHHRSESG